jgi:hypothetical protein
LIPKFRNCSSARILTGGICFCECKKD